MDGRRSPTPYFRSPMVATIHAMTSRPSMLLRAVLIWCAPNSVNAARQFQKDVCTSSAPLQAAEEEEAGSGHHWLHDAATPFVLPAPFAEMLRPPAEDAFPPHAVRRVPVPPPEARA